MGVAAPTRGKGDRIGYQGLSAYQAHCQRPGPARRQIASK